MITFERLTKESIDGFNLDLSSDKKVRRQITLILYELNRSKHNLHNLVVAKRNDKILGAYLEYRSRIKKPCLSTTNLYNIFSLESGTGSALLHHWWQTAHTDGIKLFKIHADFRSAGFYHKFGFKWWNIDSYGISLNTFGPLLDKDIRSSNNKFFSDPVDMSVLSYDARSFIDALIKQGEISHAKALLRTSSARSIFEENKAVYNCHLNDLSLLFD